MRALTKLFNFEFIHQRQISDIVLSSKNNLYMDGPAIFDFTLSTVPDLVEQTLLKNNLLKKDVDLFVFHQANKFMLDALRDKLQIPEEKFFIDLEQIGNTVSSSIPIAIAQAESSNILQRGMSVLLAGFGVGYSWAGCVFDF